MRSLVIDDSQAICAYMEKILTSLDATEITTVNDAVSALNILSTKGFYDVVFVDWNMPEMSGFDFLCIARMNPEYSDTVFIMVTTEGQKDRMEMAIDNGADGYITKPFTPDVIAEKLAEMSLPAPVGF